ncbi:MAG: eL32 family ribosomal protein [Nanoarchaeota archaeon]
MIQSRKKPNFLRRNCNRHIKLGSRQKTKQKWRGAKGRDNKIRLKQRGYPAKPSIGWGSDKKAKNKINGMEVKKIENLNQIDLIKKGEQIIIRKIGKKKREEIIKKANEKGIIILNKYYKKQNAIS